MLLKKSISSILGGAILLTPCYTPLVSATENISGNPQQSDINKSEHIGFQKEFYLNQKDSKLNLFDKYNLNLALQQGLEFILNDKTSSFIDNKSTLNQCIIKNKSLCKYIESVSDYIKTTKDSENDQQLEILKQLTIIKKLMLADKEIPQSNNFFKFISAMEYAYKTIISRKIASEVLSENCEKVESAMSSQNSSTGIDVSGGISQGALNVGLSIGAKTEESSSEKSFYKINTSGTIGISIGIGYKDFISVNTTDTVGVTHSLVLYSLEQFLDSYTKDGKITTVNLREPDIKKIITSRKQMQQDEKNLLSVMQTSLEWYLKATEIVPQSIVIDWPSITITKSGDVQKSIGNTLSTNAAAKCFASLGMNVSAESSATRTYIKNSYLNLINEDCSPSDYVEDASKIIDFLKQDKTKKYNDIKTHFESYGDKKINIIPILIANIIGDIRRYNSALSILADPTTDKESRFNAQKIKNQIEEDWIGNSKIHHINKGRLDILKTAIAVSTYLRTYVSSEEEISSFKKLYSEIEHLAKMQIFSKNSSKQKAEYSTSRSTFTTSINGKTYLNIPVIGSTALSAEYIDNIGDANFDTSKDLTIKMQLPMFGDKLLGKHSIKNEFQKLITRISEKDNAFAPMLKDSLSLIYSKFENILKSLGIETKLCIPNVFSMSNYMLLNFYLTKINKSDEADKISPLPGCLTPITKDKDEWALKLIKRIDTASSDLKLSVADCGINASNKTGKASSIIGDNTFTFITGRYNVGALGMSNSDRMSNYLWNNFKKSQSEQFKKLFINIGNKENACYELQEIWNEILNNIRNNKKYTLQKQNSKIDAISKCFEEFLISCNDLVKEDSFENFEKTSTLLDKVMDYNYKYNYMVELKRVHGIK